MEEDEVCMTMSAEIEEIAYNDELTCVHKEFESCHDTFKSVLRKSMVKEKNKNVYIKALLLSNSHFMFFSG